MSIYGTASKGVWSRLVSLCHGADISVHYKDQGYRRAPTGFVCERCDKHCRTVFEVNVYARAGSL